MSDTPRTDAEANGKNPFGTLIGDNLRNALVPSDFARQLERELSEATAENTRLRAALASSKDPCLYCQLPKGEMAKCRSGFPGCARADDLMGCPELGAALEVERLKLELASVTKGSLELEEERDELDRELQDLDRKWKESARRITQLEHALSFVTPKCDYLHHPKKYQHKITEPCPVEELIRKAKCQ